MNNTSKLKVLLVTHYYPAHRGGIEIVAGQIAQRLLKTGNIHLAWAASAVDAPPHYGENFEALPAPAWNVTEKTLGLPFPLWSFGALRKLWQAVRAADVVHLHDYLYMGNQFAFWFGKWQRKPVIITQHIGFIPYKNPFFSLLLAFLNQSLGKITLAHSDQAVFISESVKDYFSQNVSFKNPPLFIANGVDEKIFSEVLELKRDDLRAKLNWKDKTVFLFVGRFVDKKGLPVLKELARRFPQVSWVFAGWGPDNPEKWQLPNVTVFSGRSAESLAELYHGADLLVLPSRGEGFPLVVQEAMSCGLPVKLGRETVQAYPAASELLFSAPAEGKESETAELWAAEIEKILKNPAELTAKRKRVAAFAREHWNWNDCAARYEEILHRLEKNKK